MTAFPDSTMLKQGLDDPWAIYTETRDRRDRPFVVDEEMANEQVPLLLGVQAAIVQWQLDFGLAEAEPVSRVLGQ
jgi:hypothetical protein